MPPLQSIPPPITVTPALEITERDNPHEHRRRFIGPLPDSILSQAIVVGRHHERAWFRSWSTTASDNSDDWEEDPGLRTAIQKHALQFFLGHGGRREDWGESAERRVREEMMRKWKESEWGKLRRQRKEAKLAAKRWMGTSFDVGVFLGVDVLHHGLSESTRVSSAHAGTPALETASQVPPSTAVETFVTAHSHLSPPASGTPPITPFYSINDQRHSFHGIEALKSLSADSSTAVLGRHITPNIEGVPEADTSHTRRSIHEDEFQRPISADSSTALLVKSAISKIEDISNPVAPQPQVFTEPLAPPRTTAFSDTNLDSAVSVTKGKGKMVHYAEPPGPEEEIEERPVPPSEVLARTGSDVQDTSAGAAQQATLENQVKWGDVVMRDRMLVRASYTEAESVGSHFDEAQNRITPRIQNDIWTEYIVAWRKDRIELYRDHSTPGKEWFTRHKHLTFIIPLNLATTHLSLYSFVDLTFCLTCPSAPLRLKSSGRWLSYGPKRGTNIFVFKPKSRTRAVDWVWQLWRHLGNTFPPFIEIRSPALDTRMKIDIPNYDTSDVASAYSVFTRSNIIALCQKGLRTIPEYKVLIEQYLNNGATLELAWRNEMNLDWVWQLEDVVGKSREWAVLCGLALRQGGKQSHLELRLKEHISTRLHLRDGTRLDEPMAIEGYLERIRPNTQLKQPIYLSTHNGYLFALATSHAHPPMPPGTPLDLDEDAQSLHEAEVRRGTRQIMEATGVSDLRSIVAIRRAFQQVPTYMEQPATGRTPGNSNHNSWEDTEEFWAHVERSGSDDEDKGGDEGLASAGDKAEMRMRRSFELVLTSGRVVRFETYSCQIALEWITRLRPLVSYWKKRHQEDARNEMGLAHRAGYSKLTPPTLAVDHDAAPELPPDPEASLPELSSFYNWCVLDACRPILKCGRLFGKKGTRGQYRQIQLVLVSGHIIQFHITGKTSLHHRRHLRINLLDAYICSGYLAAQQLPQGQYHPDSFPLARRYQDGLESDEHEEDTLFVLWYRNASAAQVSSSTAAPVPSSINASPTAAVRGKGKDRDTTLTADVPPLSAKHKIVVFRTRSKLERDAWVWAISSEIEKIVRAAKDREQRVREAGELLKT